MDAKFFCPFWERELVDISIHGQSINSYLMGKSYETLIWSRELESELKYKPFSFHVISFLESDHVLCVNCKIAGNSFELITNLSRNGTHFLNKIASQFTFTVYEHNKQLILLFTDVDFAYCVLRITIAKCEWCLNELSQIYIFSIYATNRCSGRYVQVTWTKLVTILTSHSLTLTSY